MDLPGEVIEVGAERSTRAQGQLGAGTGEGECGAGERSMAAVEGEHGVGFALGPGQGAAEQFAQFGKQTSGSPKPGSALGRSRPVQRSRSFCSCPLFRGLGRLGWDARERFGGEGLERVLASLGGEQQHAQGVDGVIGEAVALSGLRGGDAEAPVGEGHLAGLGVGLGGGLEEEGALEHGERDPALGEPSRQTLLGRGAELAVTDGGCRGARSSPRAAAGDGARSMTSWARSSETNQRLRVRW